MSQLEVSAGPPTSPKAWCNSTYDLQNPDPSIIGWIIDTPTVFGSAPKPEGPRQSKANPRSSPRRLLL